MNKKHKISIIMPVYNTKPYLESSIKSLLNQTYDNWELIVVDDGSKDGSSILLDDIANKQRDDRIRLFHKQNDGLSGARNFGISKVRGDFIVFFDSDDMLEMDLLNKINLSINEFSTDLVLFPYQNVDENGNQLPTRISTNIYKQNEKTFSGNQILDLLLAEKIKNYAWQFAVRTRIIQENNIEFPYGLLFEDIATTYKIFKNSERVSIINGTNYLYRKHTNSIVNSNLSKKSVNDYTKATKYVYDDLIATENPLIEGYYLHRLYENYRRIVRRNLQSEFPTEIKYLKKEMKTHFSFRNIKTFSIKQKIIFLSTVFVFN